MNLNQLLHHKKPLIFDGALGTELSRRNLSGGIALNLNDPDPILNFHREYAAIGVDFLLKIKVAISPLISDESCIIVALLHDLGKVGMPGKPQYLEGDKYPYSFNKDLTFLSVPIRSIYLALPYIELSEAEVQAIVYHDGQYVDDNASVARKEEPLTLLLQYADTWSGFVLEKSIKQAAMV